MSSVYVIIEISTSAVWNPWRMTNTEKCLLLDWICDFYIIWKLFRLRLVIFFIINILVTLFEQEAFLATRWRQSLAPAEKRTQQKTNFVTERRSGKGVSDGTFRVKAQLVFRRQTLKIPELCSSVTWLIWSPHSSLTMEAGRILKRILV